MEPSEAAPDLVGRTSARLLAAGVDRRERVDALRLLAILDASTDAEGRIRRPLDDLAAEFELEPVTVLRSMEHLEHAGAVERDGGAVVLLGDGRGLGGLHLADFLDDVRVSFDGELAAFHEDDVGRLHTRLARSGAALVVAVAAVVGLVVLGPGSTPTVVQPVASGSSSTTAAETTTTAVPGDDVVPVPTPAAPGDDVPVPTTAAEGPVTGTEPAPTSAPVDTTVPAATVCPTSEPVAQLVDDIVRITNPTGHDVEVTSLTVGDVTLTVPFTVLAGGSVDRPVVALLTDGGATVDDWHFTDTTVARSCPS